jgi:hypothetical protein
MAVRISNSIPFLKSQIASIAAEAKAQRPKKNYSLEVA